MRGVPPKGCGGHTGRGSGRRGQEMTRRVKILTDADLPTPPSLPSRRWLPHCKASAPHRTAAEAPGNHVSHPHPQTTAGARAAMDGTDTAGTAPLPSLIAARRPQPMRGEGSARLT